MATYLELKAQAEKLLAEAEVIRQEEITQVIVDIKAKMTTYGLTVLDLGLVTVQASTKTPSAKAPMKYRGPSGQEWGGGRGRKPDWILTALKKGESLDQFLINKP